MKIYSCNGIDDFIICCGYKGYIIKEFFANYFLHMSDVTFNLSNTSFEVLRKNAESWKVTLVDTGDLTQTGGRLRRVRKYLDEDFCMTYGDGLGSIDIAASIAFHRQHGKLATLTAVQPPGRFGALELNGSSVTSFAEKPIGDGGWINGGFFVLNPSVIDRIAGDDSYWEREPMESLAKDNELQAYLHSGFWHPMDTLRDKEYLQALWKSGEAPWKIWK